MVLHKQETVPKLLLCLFARRASISIEKTTPKTRFVRQDINTSNLFPAGKLTFVNDRFYGY
jgi:hypothetical protein